VSCVARLHGSLRPVIVRARLRISRGQVDLHMKWAPGRGNRAPLRVLRIAPERGIPALCRWPKSSGDGPFGKNSV
jgi:hypothetical protein